MTSTCPAMLPSVNSLPLRVGARPVTCFQPREYGKSGMLLPWEVSWQGWWVSLPWLHYKATLADWKKRDSPADSEKASYHIGRKPIEKLGNKELQALLGSESSFSWKLAIKQVSQPYSWKNNSANNLREHGDHSPSWASDDTTAPSDT